MLSTTTSKRFPRSAVTNAPRSVRSPAICRPADHEDVHGLRHSVLWFGPPPGGRLICAWASSTRTCTSTTTRSIRTATSCSRGPAKRVSTEDAFSELRALAMHPKVVAIGETGLDFGGRSAPVEAQRDAFRAHLILAWERRLPVIVHCRGAHRDVLEMLADAGTAVVMHAFSGSVETVRECAACGHFISLAGPVTFRNADLPVKVAREVPAALLLVETDAPVLAPHPCRGKRNEPAYLRYIVDRLAEIRAVPVEDLIETSAANAARVFGV